MLQQFIAELNWPDEVLATHLMKRLKLMASDMVQSCVKRYELEIIANYVVGCSSAVVLLLANFWQIFSTFLVISK